MIVRLIVGTGLFAEQIVCINILAVLLKDMAVSFKPVQKLGFGDWVLSVLIELEAVIVQSQ